MQRRRRGDQKFPAAASSRISFNPPVHPRAAELFRRDFAQRHARYLALVDQHCMFDFNDTDHGADWPTELFLDSSHLTSQHQPLLE
ncbi:MAG TPA: hypothetical protein VNS22_19165 [Geminicoccus sp.]|uniref:hypothetical protein n=1 Tax=Geminicoccus sp. TaxID=2024832 RepID=UPI002BED85BC|nr:hypothetical protein [Geminicoccus sp.]HWL70481.1 hypothetical protein [Geminicoccus sp.]